MDVLYILMKFIETASDVHFGHILYPFRLLKTKPTKFVQQKTPSFSLSCTANLLFVGMAGK